MSKGTTSYRIKDENALYFLTFSTVEWIDVFTRKLYRDILVDSFRYCRMNKGLKLYSWVIMSNHVHMIVSASDGFKLSGILRDMKKHTSKKIIKSILEENESRKEWLVAVMQLAANRNSKEQKYQLWRNDNHPIELERSFIGMIDQKMNYIHDNPVEADIVEKAEDYLYSSARNYSGLNGMIEIDYL